MEISGMMLKDQHTSILLRALDTILQDTISLASNYRLFAAWDNLWLIAIEGIHTSECIILSFAIHKLPCSFWYPSKAISSTFVQVRRAKDRLPERSQSRCSGYRYRYQDPMSAGPERFRSWHAARCSLFIGIFASLGRNGSGTTNLPVVISVTLNQDRSVHRSLAFWQDEMLCVVQYIHEALQLFLAWVATLFWIQALCIRGGPHALCNTAAIGLLQVSSLQIARWLPLSGYQAEGRAGSSELGDVLLHISNCNHSHDHSSWSYKGVAASCTSLP